MFGHFLFSLFGICGSHGRVFYHGFLCIISFVGFWKIVGVAFCVWTLRLIILFVEELVVSSAKQLAHVGSRRVTHVAMDYGLRVLLTRFWPGMAEQ